LGLLTGYRLAAIAHLQTYKLLNATGLFYDLLGVLVLSDLAASNERWKLFAVTVIAPAIMWLHVIFPLAVTVSAGLSGLLLHLPSSSIVAGFAFAFWSSLMIPLTIFEWTVALPRFAALKGLQSRWRWFALLLLLAGVSLQFAAAILSLSVA
jgi:hypothetical protein